MQSRAGTENFAGLYAFEVTAEIGAVLLCKFVDVGFDFLVGIALGHLAFLRISHTVLQSDHHHHS